MIPRTPARLKARAGTSFVARGFSRAFLFAISFALAGSQVDARVVRLRIERREPVLDGRSFDAAGPYEKLVGRLPGGLSREPGGLSSESVPILQADAAV